MPPKKASCSHEEDVLGSLKDDIDQISDSVKRVASKAYQQGKIAGQHMVSPKRRRTETAGPSKRPKRGVKFPLKTTEDHRNTHVLLVAADSQKKKEQQIFKNDVMDMKAAIGETFPELSKSNIHEVIGTDVTDGTSVASHVHDELVKMRGTFGQKDFFIFYYSGHMDVSEADQRTFYTGQRDEDFITDVVLKDLFRNLNATRYLFILDCCQASAASLGAKGKKRGVPNPIPRLPDFWKLFDRGPSTSKERQPRAVQWGSCAADGKSYCDEKSYFTEELVNLLNGTVCNIPRRPVNLKFLNECLTETLADRDQTPELQPEYNDSFYNNFLTFDRGNEN
ncbi:uncharacterized protein LOC124133618 [Haliotis rufescens]|uniref:uncharacterized protein LOC124133618 n=1 Tax=Haliotis rufescens TaxID=6454 RepID=UPI00201E8E58|nr:uncharacterized protein LOC124133618 [Haliotis rufescens]